MSRTQIYNVGAHGIPEGIVKEYSRSERSLRWSHHARRELVNDRYGVINFAPFLGIHVPSKWELVEAETEFMGGEEILTKFVVRREIDPARSLVLVIVPDGPVSGLVVTAWINLNTDNHRTLDKTRFDKP
jgi:hypothetical protein